MRFYLMFSKKTNQMYKKHTILIVLFFSILSVSAQKKYNPEWLFIYYMPYDNNLSEYGATIKNMLKKGLVDENIMVTIQADFADTLGIKRYILSKDTIIQNNILTENSASTNTFNHYLTWINDNFTSKNYCLIFLDHGGHLDELCLDENPEFNFLKIDSINNPILNFNKKTGKKIELTFLQVCAKGSIEAIYEIKDCSNYTMFSQVEMGAPNYYYEEMLKYVAQNPNIQGCDIAEQIVLNERDDMYNSYVCIENNKFDSLKIHFNDFIQSFDQTDKVELYDSTLTQYYYYHEYYWDIKSFLNSLELDETSKNKKDILLNYIINEFIVFNKTNPKYPIMNKYCGLSLFAFTNKNYSSYKHLQFFKDFKINELQKKISLIDNSKDFEKKNIWYKNK